MIADNPYHPPFPAHGKESTGVGNAFLFFKNRDFSGDGVELSAMKFVSALINGRGHYNNNPLPVTSFRITRGSVNRFRIINVGSEFSFQIRFECHFMKVVALDGNEIVPVIVDEIMIHPGERIDIQIQADQNTDCYWIRARTLKDCSNVTEVLKDECVQEVRAQLVYDNKNSSLSTSSSAKTSQLTQCSSCLNKSANHRIVFNCPFKNFSDTNVFKCFDMNSILSLSDDIARLNNDDKGLELFLNFAFTVGSSINSRKFVMPSSPAYDIEDASMVKCDEAACKAEGCSCTHIVTIPPNRKIRMVLMSYEPSYIYPGHHVVHLHGHHFAVLYTGYPGYDPLTGLRNGSNTDIICKEPLCMTPTWSEQSKDRNLSTHPPIRDTVIIPAFGYVLIEFVSNNPGFWLFHCHQESHMIEGMTLLLNESFAHQRGAPANFIRPNYCQQHDCLNTCK